jgi:hypothetical protein
MLFPPTKVTDPELMTVVAPAVFPDVLMTRALWTEGVVAEMVILPAPAPTLTIPDPEIFSRLEKVPEELEVVLPSAVSEIREVWMEAEIVMVEAAWPIPIPAPAEMDIAPVEPLRDETTFALAAGAGTEIVTLPAPTPTEAIPAPEN